jgi:hypothetical protein
MRNYFCILSIEKIDLDEVLRTHNLPLERFKINFVEVDESMFPGVELPCEFIFSILGIVTSDLDEGA